MRPSSASCALALLAVALACGPGEPPAEQRPSVTQDERLAWLLQPFPRSDHYDADTSDTIGILREVLLRGQRDPLKRARLELAQEGPPGVDAARRIIEGAWNDPSRFADIRNALDVLSYAATPQAHDVIARVLLHESSAPRQAAWRALRPVAQPSDYDRLRELIDIENPEFIPELALLLHTCDPERAALEYLEWIETGKFEPLWTDVVRSVAATPGEPIARRACALYAGREPAVQGMLAASCTRTGDPVALALLREWQRSDKPGARQLAIEALISAELYEELAWTLERDREALLRRRVAEVIGTELPPEISRPLLEEGMNDANAEVAAACVGALVAQGHPGAIERAFQDLSSTRPGDLENAMLILRQSLSEDPQLAERAFERLHARAEEEVYTTLPQRRPTLRALGLVPSRRAAEYLDGLSRRASGMIQNIGAPRWLLLQVGNGGDPGQRYLVEALEDESDLLRRLDLIEALASTPTELANDWLVERAQADDVPPYELLYIADRLTRVGPTKRIAPVLKRATLRVEQDDVRRALQGLLWVWYPAPRAG